MTIFGGVFALDANREIPDKTAQEFAKAISRNPADKATLHTGPGYALGFIDLGLLPGQGDVVDAQGARSFLGGDLLLRSRADASRTDDLRTLHEAWLGGDNSLLARMRGSFAVVQLDPARGTLRLAVDLFCVRSLYVSFVDGLVYFASALRILEDISALKKRLDHRGLLEMTAFGFSLATRTPYEDIELLDGAEVIEVSRSRGIKRTKYWRWDELAPTDMDMGELSRAMHQTFQDAVTWRLGKRRSVLSFFSGGLDSRCVTASLLAAGAQVHSVNIAPEGSLDLVLGRNAAERMKTRHFEYPHGPADGAVRIVAGHVAWLASLATQDIPEFPSAPWTGNGGSVGLGHVYLDDTMVSLMQQGRRSDAVKAYLHKNRIQLTPMAFQPEFRSTLEACCFDGVLEQVQQLASFDEGRRLHLFLMLNDQRRHSAALYEDIDRCRLETINPFFDAAFMRLVLSAPIEPFIHHRFYNTWLKEFPYALDTIPWQAYDDHEPCPLPMPKQLVSQWEEGFYSKQTLKEASAQLLAHSSAALASENFPGTLLRRPVLQIAWWMTRAGIRDYSYLLKIASNLTHYSSKASA